MSPGGGPDGDSAPPCYNLLHHLAHDRSELTVDPLMTMAGRVGRNGMSCILEGVDCMWGGEILLGMINLRPQPSSETVWYRTNNAQAQSEHVGLRGWIGIRGRWGPGK